MCIRDRYVAIVNSLHYEYCLKALNAGKHVVCEKPFSLKYEEAKKLKEMAEQKKLFLFEAITTRHMPVYSQLFDIIEEIGNIKAVFCNLSKYSSRYDDFVKGETPNVFNPSLGGGALEDINIYNIHFCVGLFGEPMEVSYYANIIRDIDVSGTLILKYDNFTALCVGAKNNNCLLYTSLGTVRINASAYYPSFYRNSKKVGTSDYLRVMRLRKIWAEGTFAVLKREHKLNKIQKRGLQKAIEECLLSATALNLKRLAKAV